MLIYNMRWPGRARRIEISYETLANILCGEHGAYKTDLPTDMRVIDVYKNHEECETFWITVESESFSIVKDGNMIPVIMPEVTTLPVFSLR